MKQAVLILGVIIYCTACKTSVHDNGCIIRYTGPGAYSYLKQGQLDTIQSLFRANGLSMDNLQFTWYSGDTVVDSGFHLFVQYADASPVLNGLPVFSSYRYWAFRNGVFYRPNSNTAPFPPTSGDTTTHQTLLGLRSLFFKIYEAALFSLQNTAPHLRRPGYYYRDSCLFAQLGYIDASSQPGSATAYGTQLLKVWEIVPQQEALPGITGVHTLAPTVYVIDSSGTGWCAFPYYPGDPILIYSPIE
ncbi:hypothetical protein [Puia dinghuensis]|uniref:Uncharacterized protein n=1 Tax=Puia dinghuensis TaxID=1792502 RepID=A0A8J2XTJ0_9BACT|nr:hypothetical protein [Puia dinghuensis]GGB17725.1 hypothetical protein GCM10011511_46910 [Puia dinghuensis]